MSFFELSEIDTKYVWILYRLCMDLVPILDGQRKSLFVGFMLLFSAFFAIMI